MEIEETIKELQEKVSACAEASANLTNSVLSDFEDVGNCELQGRWWETYFEVLGTVAILIGQLNSSPWFMDPIKEGEGRKNLLQSIIYNRGLDFGDIFKNIFCGPEQKLAAGIGDAISKLPEDLKRLVILPLFAECLEIVIATSK